jgi:hypothetical protein
MARVLAARLDMAAYHFDHPDEPWPKLPDTQDLRAAHLNMAHAIQAAAHQL